MAITNQDKPLSGDKTKEIDIKKDLAKKSEEDSHLNEKALLDEVGDIMDKAEQMKADSQKNVVETQAQVQKQEVVTQNNVASNNTLVSTTTLKNYDDAISSLRGKNTFLSFVLLLSISALGFVSYEFYDKINKLNIDMQQVENNILSKNNSQFDKLKADSIEINNLNTQLRFENKELKDKIDALIKEQVVTLDAVKNLNLRINSFEDKDPNAWKIAESFFEVKHAYQQLLLNYDTTASITLLKQADQLLVGIQNQDILDIRRAIANDIAELSAVSKVDYQGILFTLNSVYRNIDKLVLSGYSNKVNFTDDKQRVKTDNIADWKNNLIESAIDFSSKFIEIRRIDSNQFKEFLTPEQGYFLRENVKSRLLLAQISLSNHETQSYKENLIDAKELIKKYFDENSSDTTSSITILDKLIDENVNISIPNTLTSFDLFNQVFNKTNNAISLK